MALLAALLLAAPAAPSAQDVTESALKAAYLHNFARFTRWPESVLPPAAPLVYCVQGDAAVHEALERTTAGQRIDGHGVRVVRIADDEPIHACHLLYVSGVGSSRMARVIDATRGLPVLTIGDSDDFIRAGGIARFFFDRGRLRFSIGHDSARQAGLQLSPQLLSLARQP